ncbi:MAG: peptidyl-prolyl cis-trans isomerase [Firmicutes bacterium]|nr:peptidyl-prolyl cis-trans isomerase [Bacillota bacterium]MCL5971603.1 peptidyl-prolyl cis-trans isomerase [Bacillota bacterium]
MFRRRAGKWGAVVIVVTLFAGCGNASSSPIARVNGITITHQDWMVSVGSTEILTGTPISTHAKARKAQIMALVQQTAVEHWALAHKVISSPKAAQQASDFLQHQVIPRLGNAQNLTRSLSQHHVTMSEFRRYLANQMILEAAFNRVTAGENTLPVGAGSAFYHANPALFVTPTAKLAREMIVNSRQQAVAIETQLKKGADFSALARRDSKDRASLKTGGSLGWVKLGVSSSLPARVTSAINHLAPGQYGIVATRLGYSIIEVQAVKPGTSVPYSDVRPEIEAQLVQKQKAQAFQHWAAGLMRQAHVQLYQNG